MSQLQSKQAAANWAEFIQMHADQKVKRKNDPNAEAKHLLTYGNNPKTRVMVLSMDKQNDEKLVDIIKKDAQKKADKVKYVVVPLQDFTKNGQFLEDEFLKRVKCEYRPTLYVMNRKTQTFEIREAWEVLDDNRLTRSEELTESKDGNFFYEAKNISVPEQEPVILTFSVSSSRSGVKEELTHLLRENNASIPNHKSTRVLIISGSHGGRRKDSKGNIDPIGGESGLSYQDCLNNEFYRQDCGTVGIIANPSHFDEYSDGDFRKWKTPSFTRPDILTVTPCVPLPAGSLLRDPDFDEMQFQVLDLSTYHNKPELRGTVRKSPAAAFKRCEELVQDVVAYKPTVIFVAWCFSCNGDIALALRAEGVFSELIVEHELRSITGDPHAKLDRSQRDVLREMCQDSVKHVVLAGPSGAGKTVMGCEGAKKEAAKLKKKYPEATVEIHVVSCVAVSESSELLKLLKTKYFKGLSAFQVKYWTCEQLCAELGLNIEDYDYDKCIEFIIEACKAKDTANKVHERNGGGQLFSVFMVDEAATNPAKDEKVQDWTELGQLKSLSTVRTITCVQPSSGVGSSGQYTVKLPSSSDARHQPTSFCSRLLNVGYRNSPSIRNFNNFLVDHAPGMPYLKRGTDFEVGTHTPSTPAGTKGVEWIQCSRTEDLGKAARKAVEECGSDNTVVLYWDREGDVCKVAAEASTATSVVRWDDYWGCEHTNVITISNYGIAPEATTRAREKLVMVTGPGLHSASNHILSEAAASGHEYKRFSEIARCTEDPCGWSGNCVGEFPMLEHKVFCATKDCGQMFGGREDKCPKCGWEAKWSRLYHMSLNGQLLEYVGQGGNNDIGFAQAKMPLSTGSHYFVIEIIEPGSNCEIAIGLAGKDYPKNNLPGWKKGSIGYHADNGKIYEDRGVGDPFGPLCNKGDIMGCGIMWVEQEVSTHHGRKLQVYFTRNGNIIGKKEALVPRGGFFPTIGMMNCQAKVRVDLKPDCGPVFGGMEAKCSMCK